MSVDVDKLSDAEVEALYAQTVHGKEVLRKRKALKVWYASGL